MVIIEDATTTDHLSSPSRKKRSGSSSSQRMMTTTVKRTTEKKKHLPKEKPQLKAARAAATVKRKSELNLLINLSQTERTIKKERIQEPNCRCDR